ncbi:hypothetical protein HNO88_003437 [Novosphingobium chloroacetimidivorans]|uniref:Uncharacterized protein n=1 Tax=Novosphingobium chloroacetimidivorans TaxID=1428314 RepID=A0A7W7KC34_9SPHN|nr:hypothetical protein [Novosphingobium chloroacetimidivorans]MBB4860099.1 hypothetical protein [Novosphingobium chloroacetimidivorans]
MSAAEIDPDRLRDLLHDCVASGAAQQADRLREAAALLGPPGRRDTIEAMLACGACESAALAILDKRGFLVSRAVTGTCLASVQLGDGEDMTAEAATPALALLAAHIAALLADALAARPQPSGQLGAAARLH